MSVADEIKALTQPKSQFPPANISVSSYFRWKGILDRTLALLLLVPGTLMIGMLVVIVRSTSPGPAIFSQVRVGKNGRKFTMYKLRTMRVDAEEKTGAVWCQENDPRITRIGKVLRKLHLDELPQIYNVLLGQMSLVGPRPERPSFVIVLEQEIPGYSQRLAVAPGVTGLAQINLPPDTDVNSVRRKLVLDQQYIETGSLLMDLRMLLCTFLRIIGIKGIWAAKLTMLHRSVELPLPEAPLEDCVDDAPATPGAVLRRDQALLRQAMLLPSNETGEGEAGSISAEELAAANGFDLVGQEASESAIRRRKPR